LRTATVWRTHHMNSSMTRFTEKKLCPVCGMGSKGCSATADGLHFCRGDARDDWRKIGEDDAGFGHYRRGDDPPNAISKPLTDWQSRAEGFAANLARFPEHRARLAAVLGLPKDAFGGFTLGMNGYSNASAEFTVPERDGKGAIIGLATRIEPMPLSGKNKLFIKGGKRGLTIPDGWRDKPGPLLLVEGFTDTAALTAAGLCAIGRQSNLGGSELLAELLAKWPTSRGIIVVGENDENGAGLNGAIKVSGKLSALLRRKVPYALPPKEAKDVREWLTDPARGETPWSERGSELLHYLEANATKLSRNARLAKQIPEYRRFPVEALPPALREFSEQVAASVGCDVVFAALPALTLAGAAVGASVVAKPKRGWKEPPAIWACIVADSGTGKSPAMKDSSALAFAIDRELRDAFIASVAQYKEDCECYSAKMDEFKAAEGASGAEEPEKPRKPKREYFAVVDATIERLAEMLGDSPRGLLVVRDELAGWFGSFSRYKGQAGGTDVPNWLSLYDCGPIRVHRRTGEPRDIETDRAFAAVFGGIQPDILARHLAEPGYVESGLAARILFAAPPKYCPGWRDEELDPETERRFGEVLRRLRAMPCESRKPAELSLDSSALERFKSLNNEFAWQAENVDGGPMSAALPKATRYALRFALIHHCVTEASHGRDGGRGCISDEAMAAGETLARWFVHEAERVYATIGEKPEERETRRIAELVKRLSLHHGGTVRPRDLQRANEGKYPTAEIAEAALDSLVFDGLGTWLEVPIGSRGGRPARAFVLIPSREADSRQNPTEPPPHELPSEREQADTTPGADS